MEAAEIAERLADPDLLSGALDAVASWPLFAGLHGEAYHLIQRRVELLPKLTSLREFGDTCAMAAWCATHIGLYREAIQHVTGVEQRPGIEPYAYIHALAWRTVSRFMAGDWAAPSQTRSGSNA